MARRSREDRFGALLDALQAAVIVAAIVGSLVMAFVVFARQ